MLSSIIKWAIARRWLVIVGAMILSIWIFRTIVQMPLDVFTPFAPPQDRSVDKDINCTLRQRLSRLVRKSLSFSKKLENYVASIWNFIHDYNATRRRKLGLA